MIEETIRIEKTTVVVFGRGWRQIRTCGVMLGKRAAAPHRRRRTWSIVAYIDDPLPSNTKAKCQLSSSISI